MDKDSFTKIPNHILEAILAQKFTAVQMTVVLYVLRKTNGWNKPCDRISITQMARETGRRRQLLSRTVGDLEKLCVLKVERFGNGRVPEMSILDPKHWDKPATVQLHETAEMHVTKRGQNLQPYSFTPETVQLQEPETVQLHTKERKDTYTKERKKGISAPVFEVRRPELEPGDEYDDEGWEDP